MQQTKDIKNVTGSGKTQKIIDNSDENTLIVTSTITLSKEISRRIDNNPEGHIIHYHQLIWDEGQKIGMPLSLNNWNKYEDEFIFEKKKELIEKYSKIYVDIREYKESWIKILQRYFLENNGHMYILKESREGESTRLNGSVTKLINNTAKYKIRSNKNICTENTFYITASRSDICERINQTLKSLKLAERDKTTILASNLEILQEIEENLLYKKKVASFVTIEQEKLYDKKSLDYHWLKKDIHNKFNPSVKQIKLSTIASFDGLESDIVFIVLTEESSIEEHLYLAVSRACEKVYIFNANINFSDKLRLNVDRVYNIHDERLNTKIDIGLENEVKRDILKNFFPQKYKEYIDRGKENLDLDKIFILSDFFIKIFPLNQKIQVFNFKKEKNIQKVAITHHDTNILLIARQRIDDNKQEYNSFFCERIVLNKSQYLLKNDDCFEIRSYLSFSKDWNSDSSKVCLDKNILTVPELLNRVQEKLSITPVEETPEYQKWKIYLNLLEKSKIYKIDKIKYDKKIAIFKKPKNLNVKENDVLVYFDKSAARYKIITFGEVNQVENNTIYLKMSEDTDRVNSLELGLLGDLAQIKKLQNSLQDIKYHSMRFFIFGDQKLPQLIPESINTKFKNKKLNEKQKEAINKAIVSEKIFMIQGPPGTGKTSVICELAYQEISKNKNVLISSESNDAIENALEKVLEDDMFYPVLYQSKYRQNQVVSKNFPIETKLGLFYKNRILKKLKKQLCKNQGEYLKIDKYAKEKKKIIDKYQDNLKNDITGNNSRYQKKLDLKKLNNRYKLDEHMSVFNEIQKDFFEELEEDIACEPDLEEIYKTKINIVGATLNQIDRASRELLDCKEFDIALVDEVSKATPIELNLAILNAKKIILVGDQKQLPPMLDRNILEEVYEENYKVQDLNKNQVRELYENKTVFERLIENNPHAYVQLTTQYRMHQDIQDAVNNFYEEKLRCGLTSNERKNKHKLFDSKNLVWVDTSSHDESEKETSFKNKFEKDQVNKILIALDNEYAIKENKITVGVITFYDAQKNFLNQIGKEFKNLEIDYDTVDKFQGKERNFIIVSMVRSNNNKNIGFARSLNRINVAFSRAKQLLVILGSADTFTRHSRGNFKDINNVKNIYKKIFDLSHKGDLL